MKDGGRASRDFRKPWLAGRYLTSFDRTLNQEDPCLTLRRGSFTFRARCIPSFRASSAVPGKSCGRPCTRLRRLPRLVPPARCVPPPAVRLRKLHLLLATRRRPRPPGSPLQKLRPPRLPVPQKRGCRRWPGSCARVDRARLLRQAVRPFTGIPSSANSVKVSLQRIGHPFQHGPDKVSPRALRR